MGTSNGVTTTRVTASKWTHWGELTGIDYVNAGNEASPNVISTGAEGGVEKSPSGQPTLRRGSKGDAIRELQTMLDKLGYDLGPCGIDGDFGKATEAAVRSFQSDHRLTVDGIAGPATYGELEKSVNAISVKPEEATYSVTIGGLDLTQAQAIMNNYPGNSTLEVGRG